MPSRPRPAVQHYHGDQRDQQRQPERPEAIGGTGRRHLHATIVDEHRIPQAQAVARPRQRADYGEIDEEDQQQRRILRKISM